MRKIKLKEGLIYSLFLLLGFLVFFFVLLGDTQAEKALNEAIEAKGFEVKECVLTPKAIKKVLGQKILFKNNDPVSHRITLLWTEFTLLPEKEIEIDTSLPGTFGISCDGIENGFLLVY